jgi:transcriptional antiterminator NusG
MSEEMEDKNKGNIDAPVESGRKEEGTGEQGQGVGEETVQAPAEEKAEEAKAEDVPQPEAVAEMPAAEEAAAPEIEPEKKPKQRKPRAKKAELEIVEQPAPAELTAETPADVPAEEQTDRKWYVVQTYSGQEDKVKDSIERNVSGMNMGHKIFQILVPTEDTVEIRDGKRIEKNKKMFPGYVFVDMILDDESWYMIRGTQGVAKFIGTKVRPTPVSDKEMQRVLKQLGVKEEKLEVSFERGEVVRIIGGPFRGYTGNIDEVNSQKGKLKTLISIFGRDTPVEVNFEQVQRIS